MLPGSVPAADVLRAEVRETSGDEPQTGVRGGVTQITPTDGQREGSRVSDLCVWVCVCAGVLCVKMIYPGEKKKEKETERYDKECTHAAVCACEWESETRGRDLERH